uniref:hypothetical protein n=1 Tax=Ekhidna sp. TaxID=2608089 RepID=UPI0035117BA1
MKALKRFYQQFFGLLLLMLSVPLAAQEFTAAINTETPNPNAVLHLVAPNGDQGLLVPVISDRATMAAGLGTGDNGLLIYDSSASGFYFWNGSAWVALNVPANIADGIDFSELTGVPAGLADGDDVGITTVAVDGTTINGDGDITPLSVNIGTGPGQIVQLGASSELPAVDGSLLSGVVTTEIDPTVPANIKDGIEWSEIASRPTGLDDGDDVDDADNDPNNEIQDALGVAYDNTGDLIITSATVAAALKDLDASVAAGDGDND